MDEMCSASSVRTGAGKGSSAREHRARKFQQGNTTDPQPSHFSVRNSEPAGIDPIPRLVLQQPTRHQRFARQAVGRLPILGEQVRQHDGRVDVDHRSPRSRSSSLSMSSSVATGARGGTPGPNSADGVSHP